MAGKGRPTNSEVRDKILLILKEGPKHGYSIYKRYRELFGQDTTMRNIYYHLKKAIVLNLIEIKEVKNEPGEFSWGLSCERVYYRLK